MSSSWKIFFSPIRASWWLFDSFRSPEPKNVWFLLSRLDVRRVHEKVFSRRFERADGCWTHFGLLSPKRFHSYKGFIRKTTSSWKIFHSPIRARWWLLDSFLFPQPRNVWFLLSRHDVRRVHEKVFSRRFERADGCSTHFGLLNPKRFHAYCLDMMYVEFMKNFLLADSSELMAVRLISASWAKKRLIPSFWTWCTSSSWKIFISPFERADGC